MTKAFMALALKWSACGARDRQGILSQAADLLDRGAAMERKSLSDALAQAASRGAFELLDLLLICRKPLAWEMAPAVRMSLAQGRWECARLLLNSGAPAAWPLGVEGAAPLREVCEIALAKGDAEGIRLLCEHVGWWGQEGLICGCRMAEANSQAGFEALCALWESGALCFELNEKMPDEINPLSQALMSHNAAAFEFLMDRAFPMPSWCETEPGRAWGCIAKCAAALGPENGLAMCETARRKWKRRMEDVQEGFDWLCGQGVEISALRLLRSYGARPKESSALCLCMSPAFYYHTGMKRPVQWDSWSQNKHSDAEAFAESIALVCEGRPDLEQKIAKAFAGALCGRNLPANCGSKLTSIMERMLFGQIAECSAAGAKKASRRL